MKKLLLASASLVAIGFIDGAMAADANMPLKAPADCAGGTVDPYKNYSCLDSYLGNDFFSRFINYYRLEWGHEAAPSDPKAPPGRRDYWPATPESIPPMPFTEWPYGGTTALGVTRTSSVDSPLMAALGNTAAGQALNDSHIQIYGWINAGGNLSNNTVRGGNAPAAYDYNPNTVQLDQAVVYIERLPDTVQNSHFDWGYHLTAFYGNDYRFTTAKGYFSQQLLLFNRRYGFDPVLEYLDLYFPVKAGLNVRIGRYTVAANMSGFKDQKQENIDVALGGVRNNTTHCLLAVETAIVMGSAKRPDARQSRIALDLEPPRLIIRQMPMQHVEFV